MNGEGPPWDYHYSNETAREGNGKKGCWSSLTLEEIGDTVSVDLIMQHDIATLYYL